MVLRSGHVHRHPVIYTTIHCSAFMVEDCNSTICNAGVYHISGCVAASKETQTASLGSVFDLAVEVSSARLLRFNSPRGCEWNLAKSKDNVFASPELDAELVCHVMKFNVSLAIST